MVCDVLPFAEFSFPVSLPMNKLMRHVLSVGSPIPFANRSLQKPPIVAGAKSPFEEKDIGRYG